MRYFFTADSHFGHRNIIKYCRRLEFLSSEELDLFEQKILQKPSREAADRMDELLIDAINTYVKKDDVLWHVGDFSWWKDKNAVYETAEYYRGKIRCKNVHIVWGNHDDALRTIIENMDIPSDLFKSYSERAFFTLGGQKFVLDHYAGAVWKGNHDGSLQLYGHSHTSAEHWLDDHMGTDRRAMDVGVDNARLLLGEYRPFSYEEIRSIMDHKKGVAIDHHDASRTKKTL